MIHGMSPFSSHLQSISVGKGKGNAFKPVLHAAAMVSCQEWQGAFAPPLAPEGQKEVANSC